MTNLRELSETILDSGRPASTLRPEVLALTELAGSASGFRFDRGIDVAAGETETGQGLAISPAMAALCAEDYARAVAFMRGLAAAVDSRRASDRPTRVLYAGCGPFGLLALPTLATRSAAEVSLTLIDLHETSLRSAREALEGLGLSDRLERAEVCDVLAYRVSEARPPDVVLLEMMQAALEREPQVAATRHLMREAAGAVLVPRSVRIDAVLLPRTVGGSAGGSPRQGLSDRVELGTVFELTAASSGVDEERPFPPATVELPARLPAGVVPRLVTAIETWDGHRLGDHDSALTLPRPWPPGLDLRGGETVVFRYRMGDRPGLRCALEAESGV